MRAGRVAAAGLLLIAAAPAAARATVPRRPDAPSYHLDVTWTPATTTLAGTEQVSFHNPGPGALASVWIRAWPNGWQPVGDYGTPPGGCASPRMVVSVTAGGSLGANAADCSAYRIDLAAPVAAGATGSFALTFSTTVPNANDRFGTSHGISNIGNSVPILAVQDAAGWHLEPYTATGESFYSLAGSWQARITTPAGIAVASTGAVTGTATGPAGVTTTVRTPHARDFALSVGAMNVQRLQVGPTTVRLFTEPSMSPVQRGRLARWARLAMTRYPRWFGGYGSPELDVVAGAFTAFGGMEYPEMVMTDVQKNAVVHEIAHQWFYGQVGDNQWLEPWMDESFASYAESLLATPYPCDARHPVPVIPGYRLDSSMRAFDRNDTPYFYEVYLGGQCALRELQAAYGERSFFRFLRRYVRAHRYGVATTHDFLAALAAHHPHGFSVRTWRHRARISGH
jgi:hypothetical protein